MGPADTQLKSMTQMTFSGRPLKMLTLVICIFGPKGLVSVRWVRMSKKRTTQSAFLSGSLPSVTLDIFAFFDLHINFMSSFVCTQTPFGILFCQRPFGNTPGFVLWRRSFQRQWTMRFLLCNKIHQKPTKEDHLQRSLFFLTDELLPNIKDWPGKHSCTCHSFDRFLAPHGSHWEHPVQGTCLDV